MFYVYGYLDYNDEIYYIGKGKNQRYKDPHPHLIGGVPFDEDKIIFFDKDLTEEQSTHIERKLIKFYGRRGIDKGGFLVNKTKGGNGGYSGKMTQETKKKISESQKGKVVSEDTRNKIRTSLKGRKHSLDRIKNIRRGMGCEIYKFISPEGKIFEVDNLTRFCYNMDLNQGCMSHLWRKKRKSHKGWRKA